MEDIPQPSPDPYSPGDKVRIYVSENDPDARYNDTHCRVMDRCKDSLGEETGRSLDAYSYRLKAIDSGEVLDVQFRHSDVVPVDREDKGE